MNRLRSDKKKVPPEAIMLEDQTPTVVEEIPVLVGRQAIFDRDLKIIAYELLHRSGQEHRASFDCGDEASASVMSNTFVDLGLDVVTGGRPAFINFTEQLLSSDLAQLFPSDRIIAEVLEDVEATPAVVQGVKDMKEAGFKIALDDFVYRDDLIPLIELADVIKLDILELGMDKTEEVLDRLKPFDVKLLAEKVETTEEFARCKELGFDFFQGYFLCRPQIVESKTSRQSGLGLLRLMACINNPEATESDLEDVISKDAKLAYRLMTYINSSAFALRGKVTSVRHALTLLGVKTVRSWANLVVMSSAKGESGERLSIALIRARMCELIAKNIPNARSDEYFTVGLFSVLDQVLGMKMESIVESLPLSDDIADALLKQEGELGQALKAVIAYETAPNCVHDHPMLPKETLRQAFFESLAWVAEVMPKKVEGNGSI